MVLRELKMKDAPLMLEWMHDQSVVGEMGTDFSTKTLADCELFISHSGQKICDLHLAVANDDDVYMGTVSLKHIDINKKRAEFAIAMRKEAMGKGYSHFAMDGIMNIAFRDLKLSSVYWCVSKTNERARRFYEKRGYREIAMEDAEILARYRDVFSRGHELIWYLISHE